MGLAVLDMFSWETWSSKLGPNIHFLKQVHHYTIEAKYFYCTKSSKRESFSFLFWATPFDSWCWALTAFSALGLTILLHGQWFEVYAILMRQECTILRKKKVLVIFIFSTIVFTYGYESFISSSLIVPPPDFIFSHLKELIENGYKIFGATEDGMVLDQLRKEFQALNITASVESSIVPESWFLSNSDAVTALSLCNVTYAVVTNMEKAWQSAVAEKSPEVFCYFAKEATMETIPMIYTFYGDMKEALAKVAISFQETGILSFYMNFMFNCNTMSQLKRQRMLKELSAQNAVPFELRDWKMLSIFIAWGALVCIIVIEFIVELVYVKFKVKVRNWSVCSAFWRFAW